MPKVFITRHIPEGATAVLIQALGAESVSVWEGAEVIPREILLERVRGVDAILSILTERVDAELLEAAGPQLRIVANMAVGYDNVDLGACTQRGIPVSNTPGVLTETTADLAFALILAAARRVGEAERFVRAGNWHSWSPTLLMGSDVYGKTLGILGMGRIGKAVARRACGFGMPIIYHNRTRLTTEEELKLNAQYVGFETLLGQSDILSLHCPLTPDTRHIMNGAAFSKMKPGAVFVNTTRGPVVDEAALVAALKNGTLSAAGLDVFEEEPKIHPGLLECENAVLLPHLGSATLETRTKMGTIAAVNILARLAGGPPKNCLNPEVL